MTNNPCFSPLSGTILKDWIDIFHLLDDIKRDINYWTPADKDGNWDMEIGEWQTPLLNDLIVECRAIIALAESKMVRQLPDEEA
jgi:hypothetical protein